jgi:hypothetical protein
LSLLALSTLMACRHARPPGTEPLLAQAERLRGLTFTSRPDVELSASAVDGAPDVSEGRRKLDLLMEAMALTDTPFAHAHAAKVRATFDDRRNTVVVPTEPSLWRPALLHEATHALQHQRLGVFSRAAQPDDVDAWLAWRSSLEGDATVVAMDAELEFSSSPPLGLERVTRATLEEGLMSAGADAEDPLDALTVEGAVFVTALRRVGGWDLVNRAVRQPPATMMHMFSPHAWLAGVQPDELGAFPSTAGLPVRATGQAGPFVLARYLPPEVREAGVAWRGDRFVILDGPQGTRALAWVISVATEEDATRLAAAMYARAGAPCLRALRCDAGIPLWAEPRGTRVVVVRGLEPDLSLKLVDLGMQLAVRHPTPSPVGGATWSDAPAPEPYVDLATRSVVMQPQVLPDALWMPALGLKVPRPPGNWTAARVPPHHLAAFSSLEGDSCAVMAIPGREGAPLGAHADALAEHLTAHAALNVDGRPAVLKSGADTAVLVTQRNGWVLSVLFRGPHAADAAVALQRTRVLPLAVDGGDT